MKGFDFSFWVKLGYAFSGITGQHILTLWVLQNLKCLINNPLEIYNASQG